MGRFNNTQETQKAIAFINVSFRESQTLPFKQVMGAAVMSWDQKPSTVAQIIWNTALGAKEHGKEGGLILSGLCKVAIRYPEEQKTQEVEYF